MESKAVSAKRFVVEDSITRVTSDGEPHEMMTIIAGLSGLLAAIVILIVLVSLVACKKDRPTHCKNCPAAAQNVDKLSSGTSSPTSDADENTSTQSSISTCSTRPTSSAEDVESGLSNPARERASIAIAVIGSENLKGNLNKAFAGSEIGLNESLSKKKKKTRWSDEVEQQAKIKETNIDIERY